MSTLTLPPQENTVATLRELRKRMRATFRFASSGL